MVDEQDSRGEELLEKYIAKILYRQNNRKFEEKYLRKLEKNQRQKFIFSEERS